MPSLQKELVRTDSKPEYPYEQVSCDLFSADSISWLMQIAYPAIRWYGSGDTIPRPWTPEYHERSDNGPQFASAAFRSFLNRWGVIWAPSTPYFASSNGHAECNVKILKRLLTKIASPDIDSEEFIEGLIELRNTPREDGRSPCQVVFGHNVRSRVPTHHSTFQQDWQKRAEEADARGSKISEKAREHYDKSAKELQPLKVGTKVRVQDAASKLWDKVGEIVGVGRHRDYHIKVPSGRVLWRNRRFIRRYHDAFEGG